MREKLLIENILVADNTKMGEVGWVLVVVHWGAL